MITFCVETLDECLGEIETYLQEHFEEVGANKAQVGGPKMHKEAYYAYEAAGQLHILCARDAGRLIGYCVGFVAPHLHYEHSLTAHTDVYFLAPTHRKGATGVRLFKEYERTLKARGVQRVYTGTKVYKDMGKIFEFLGWKETEKLYAKWIGD